MQMNKFLKSIETFEGCIDVIKRYNDNKISLYNRQVDAMYSAKYNFEKALVDNCTHNDCSYFKGTDIEEGYGVDRYVEGFAFYCHDCNVRFINNVRYGEILIDRGPYDVIVSKYSILDESETFS